MKQLNCELWLNIMENLMQRRIGQQNLCALSAKITKSRMEISAINANKKQ